MGRKNKPQDRNKNKAVASSAHLTSTKWSSELHTVSEARKSRVIRWEISNFTEVNVHFIRSDYFELGGQRFLLQLFPNGDARRNTSRKYLGLYLQLDGDDAAESLVNTSVFVCCRLAVVNHADDSKHVSKYIFHRYAYGSNSSGQKEFMSVDSLKGPESGFLLNGTDLHIRIDALVLDDSWSFEELTSPQEERPDEEVASQVEGVYGGKFTWTIENYSLFQEMFKNNGMLSSHDFPIGESQYRIHLESQRRVHDENDQNLYLSMFLDNVSGDEFEHDKDAWCVLLVELMNEKLKKPKIIQKAYGRLGIDVIAGAKYFRGWLNLMEMSEFENPDNGHIMNNNKVKFILHFVALMERDNFRRIIDDSKNIWFLRDAASNTKKKIAGKEFFKFSWEIHNFSVIVNLLRKCQIETVSIESRRMRIGRTETRLVILPLGSPSYPDAVKLALENMTLDNRHQTEETSFLAHLRLSIENQIDPNKTEVEEAILRFGKDEKYYGWWMMLQSDLYSESGGYIINGKLRMLAYVNVLEEKLEIWNPVQAADDGKKFIKRIRWKVDNFLAWQGINDNGDLVESTYFEIEGCKFSITTTVDDWELRVSVGTDPSLDISAGYFDVKFQIGILNQKDPTRSLWNVVVCRTNTEVLVSLGNVPSLLKEEGYVVKDKILFACYFHHCVPWKGEPEYLGRSLKNQHRMNIHTASPEEGSYTDE